MEGRADDSAIEERLKEYHEYTDPAIQLFHKAGALINIDGESSLEDVAIKVNKALNIE